MNKKLIIFGGGDLGEVANYYFKEDSEYEISAFTLDGDYVSDDNFCGHPVIPFEELEKYYCYNEYYIFIALGYSKLNRLRREKYISAKNRGYRLASYVSSKATILNGGKIGENCFILEDNTIQPFSVIGNNVTMWSGNHIGHHARIGDHCFLASHIVVSGGVNIGESCFIGVNATFRDHVEIGQECLIGAGALILANAEAQGVYVPETTPRSRVPSNRVRKI
ncbi:MAG TPA: acetyltransferase [Aurantimonas sp.]